MEQKNIKLIHIDWDGPYKLSEILSLTDEVSDYGVYQIYGSHNVYGSNVLLYIGKADRQTIGKRLSQELWWWSTSDPINLQIYCGRLAGEFTPTDNQWSEEIDLAEKLLINVHKPAYNTQNLIPILDESLRNIHILNWGYYRDLLAEISGLRWTSALDTMEYNVYKYLQK
ncbi:hypothetical protein [Saliterribacillus persicus]|uniref:GIY-YIG domain-containing protein n=1 Tax=Saliterribacillus persicus TaxID=930114 RepID=A0A368XAA6_9BACI|nr:hypothetical protein [Saliterribacillus persicus]RCW62964.1 hypothetical protein DFR57_1211 [Saliterribacillus persicus]